MDEWMDVSTAIVTASRRPAPLPPVHRELDHALQRGHAQAAAAAKGKQNEAVKEDVRDFPDVVMM